MSERQPTKPIWEEEKVAKKTEKFGRKSHWGNNNCEFDEEEEKERVNKKKVNNLVQEKKKVNNVVLPPEIVPDLPTEFKKSIQNLGGTEATLDPSYKLPFVVPKKPRLRIQFVMGERQPTKPIWEEEMAAKKTKKTGRKIPRGSSDCEFHEEEEKKRANKKKVNNLVQEKKKVNNVVLPIKIVPDLPAKFEERIQNLGGTEATLVLQKELTAMDLSRDHRCLSLPRRKIKDKEFLDQAFLATG
ncbi:hypothetical protein RHMOL_Rhmol06G0279600 [Rhododendron molle]|uniref:Uncharacterized protein n=1 Tax=Rhododendron molle TaxID=49168 RepID=A0ACC0NH75_RHOML|nr:hypothetical protein RHMOL_Rhmol06G0279600 [Rhododendron molle]